MRILVADKLAEEGLDFLKQVLDGYASQNFALERRPPRISPSASTEAGALRRSPAPATHYGDKHSQRRQRPQTLQQYGRNEANHPHRFGRL